MGNVKKKKIQRKQTKIRIKIFLFFFFYPENFVVGGVQSFLFHSGFSLSQLALVWE